MMASTLSLPRGLLQSATLQAAWRAGFYGLASIVLRDGRDAPSLAEQRVLRAFWLEAFQFQRDGLRRPEVARTLRTLERRDLWRLPQFLASLPRDLRRVRDKRSGSRVTVAAEDDFPYPDYYLHDFHNQANGGLSRQAAATYEWQIRVLFAGTNRLMRQGVIDAIEAGDHLRVLDVGCGNAAWVPQARLLGRDHHVTGVDLSPYYLSEARRSGGSRAKFQQANAEALPAQWRGQFDRVVCIWLYHELPAAAQRRVTRQIARMLRPGGELLFMDAMQRQDAPAHDIAGMQRRFAADFDEPYYAAYQELDLAAHFADAGLELVDRRRLYVSNLLRLRRRPAASLPRRRRLSTTLSP